MENIKNETRREIIINFYRKKTNNGLNHIRSTFFPKLDVKQGQVYQAMARSEFGESHKQRKGTGRPGKLDLVVQYNISITANDAPFATSH